MPLALPQGDSLHTDEIARCRGDIHAQFQRRPQHEIERCVPECRRYLDVREHRDMSLREGSVYAQGLHRVVRVACFLQQGATQGVGLLQARRSHAQSPPKWCRSSRGRPSVKAGNASARRSRPGRGVSNPLSTASSTASRHDGNWLSPQKPCSSKKVSCHFPTRLALGRITAPHQGSSIPSRISSIPQLPSKWRWLSSTISWARSWAARSHWSLMMFPPA